MSTFFVSAFLLSLPLKLFFLTCFSLTLVRGNFLRILMALELLLLANNLGFIIFSQRFDDMQGTVFAVMILTLAAAEAAIGLAIAVSFYRLRGDVSLDLVSLLKG